MNRIITAVFAALVCFAPMTVQAEEESPVHLRLTLRYTEVSDAESGPRYNHFAYLETGVSFTNEYLWVDFNSPMPVVILDGVGALISFAAGGSGGLPIFGGLNPSSKEGGWITIFEISGGPQIVSFEDFHLGVGPLFQWSWQFPYFDGERVNSQPVDFGIATNLWWNGDLFEANLQFGFGNGWHKYGSWNPFVQVIPTIEIPVWGMLNLHLSGRVQYRRVSYADYEETLQVDVPTETVRGVTYHLMWALEVGPSITF